MTKALLSKTPVISSKPPALALAKTALATLIAIAICITTPIALSAQSVTTLLTFSSGDGQASPMIQGTDGNFYGGTEDGGTLGGGTIFKLTPHGTLTTLYNLCNGVGCGGRTMVAGLTQGVDGDFYGTTMLGGNCNGTAFKMTKDGALTWLYNFCSPASGEIPEASMVQAQDGNFYGTTYDGGSLNTGTLFRLTPQGQLTTIHTFCSQTGCADGYFPSGPGLLLGADGLLYGTTGSGSHFYGALFKITLSGKLTPLYSFCSQSGCADGSGAGPLVQTPDGTIYGTTYGGGTNGLCNLPSGCGTIYKITPSGQFTSIHSFCQKLNGFYCADGNNPLSLTLGSDGNLYGTTQYGGHAPNGGTAEGTVFRFTSDGTLSTLYTFCTKSNCPDGAWPSHLVQSTNGSFFGETESGTSTIFRLDAGLPPFVKMLRRFGKVGASVVILANNLGTASSVSFNGTAAAFTVLSNSEIEATVPAGATTGQVTVTTALRTLASDAVFTVVP